MFNFSTELHRYKKNLTFNENKKSSRQQATKTELIGSGHERTEPGLTHEV